MRESNVDFQIGDLTFNFSILLIQNTSGDILPKKNISKFSWAKVVFFFSLQSERVLLSKKFRWKKSCAFFLMLSY